MKRTYVDQPKDEVESILAEAGMPVKVETGVYFGEGREGAYESRITQRVDSGNFAAVVYEYGSIDTNQRLVLVNIPDRQTFIICHHRKATPAMCWGEITIVELICEGNELTVRYIDENRYAKPDKQQERKEQRYRYESAKETTEKLVAKLTPIF